MISLPLVHFPLSSHATHSMPKAVSQRDSTGVKCALDGEMHSDGESWTERGSHSKGLSEDQCMQCNCKVCLFIQDKDFHAKVLL